MPFERLGDNEQGDHPASQISDGIQKAVKARKNAIIPQIPKNDAADRVIAGKGDAVDHPGDGSAGGIEPFGALRSLGKVP